MGESAGKVQVGARASGETCSRIAIGAPGALALLEEAEEALSMGESAGKVKVAVVVLAAAGAEDTRAMEDPRATPFSTRALWTAAARVRSAS
jgi:hypothetical protein